MTDEVAQPADSSAAEPILKSSLAERREPGTTNKKFKVPDDLRKMGHDTNEPHADSPESLDDIT